MAKTTGTRTSTSQQPSPVNPRTAYQHRRRPPQSELLQGNEDNLVPDEDQKEIWNRISNGSVKNPENVKDNRGVVLRPEYDRRLSPHFRTLAVMKARGIDDYEEAAKIVYDAMEEQGEGAKKPS